MTVTDAMAHMQRLEGLSQQARRKIFNIGLSKTGNNSLRQAVHILGWQRTLGFVADEVIHRECLGAGIGPMSYAQQVDFMTDLPVVGWWRRIVEMYPKAHYILTVRDRDSWVDSLERHMTRYPCPPLSINAALRQAVYGSRDFSRRGALDAYDRNVTEVPEYFEAHDIPLLVMDICGGEGWEKLCPFLRVPAPDVPFPCANVGLRS